MGSRPQGREEVRAAIIDAARTRFAKEGLRATLRDIARDAQVNLGLVHRHFGSKEALIQAAFAQSVEAGRTRIASAEDFPEALDRLVRSANRGDDTYGRMLALLLLEGTDPLALQADHPTVERLLSLAGPTQRPLVLAALLTTFGWPVFRQFLTTATGYESEQAAFDELAEWFAQLAAKTEPAGDAAGESAN